MAVWWLARKGETPTAKAVDNRLASAASARVRARRRREQADEIAARDASAAAEYVSEVVRVTGDGPLWSEIGAKFGWGWAVRSDVIHRLAHAGWLTFTKAERSLRPGPRHRPDRLDDSDSNFSAGGDGGAR